VSGAYIHVAGADVERGYEEAFDRWYRSEHAPAALARQGWSRLRRYRCLEGEPQFLSIYDLTEEALDGPLGEAPFRAPEFSRRIRDYHARTWRRIFLTGEDPASADLINLITVDIGPEHAPAFSRWYSEVHMPEIVACPGWLGGERYECLNGDPRFLAMYGLADAERPFGTKEFESVVGWDAHVNHIRGYHGFRIYGLTERLGG
jgi:hypothetical protein